MIREVSRRYEEYKDSGVEWLDQVPKDWQLKRVKELGNLVLGKMLDNKQGANKFFKPYLKSKNIGWLKITDSNIEEMYFSSYEMKLYRVKQGDLLFSEGGEVGKTAYWNKVIDECYIQNSVHKFTANKKNHSRYLLYLSFAAGHAKFYENIVNFVSIKHLTKEKLARVVWLSPPHTEQKAIADYLDTKTAQIDKKIDLLSQKSEHYGKLKQALINETVTHGLDKSVPMKDSGIEWIGEVPKHWKIKRLKDIGVSIIGITYSPENILDNDAGGVLVLRSSNIQNGKLSMLDNVYVSKSVNKRQVLRKGDILICSRNGSRALIGKNICIDERTEGQTFGAFMTIYRSRYSRFISKFFNSNVFESQSGLFSSSTVNQLTINTLNNFLLFIPPLPEQKAIAEYLDEKTAKIDTIVEIITTQIEQLKELRKTLINDVVTGQIKVI